MTTAAQYANRMRGGKCGTCGDDRAPGSVHYCVRCLAAHRERQRLVMREKRRSDDAFRKAENEKQRLRMRTLRASRRKTKTLIFEHLSKSGFFKEIGRKGGRARTKSLTPAQRSESAKKAAQARWKAARHRKRWKCECAGALWCKGDQAPSKSPRE